MLPPLVLRCRRRHSQPAEGERNTQPVVPRRNTASGVSHSPKWHLRRHLRNSDRPPASSSAGGSANLPFSLVSPRVLATSTSSRGSLNMKSLSFVPCISSCWGRWVHTRSRLSRCTSKKHVSHRANPGPNTLQVTGARRHDTSTLTVSSEAGRTRL